VFNALFSIETENWEFSHVTMTALAVGDATPTILAFTALTAAEVEADAEPADDVAPSTAVGGEQPTTMHDSTKPATTNAIRILASIDAHPPPTTQQWTLNPVRDCAKSNLCGFARTNGGTRTGSVITLRE
jgi:hypothetical protein